MAAREAVLVAGAGALGSVVGGLLARAGWPVTLLGRAAHLEAVAGDGLVIEGLFGDHRVRGLACATDARALRGPYDVILLTVKAYDTRATAAAVAPLLARDGVLVCMQNGLGNLEAAAAAVGAERLLGARVIFGAELIVPGRVRVTVYADPVLVGSPDPGERTLARSAERWAANLASAGVPAEPTSALVAELWAKVLYNAALNPLGALLGVAYGHLAENPDTRAVMDEVVDEVFAVSAATDVRLAWPAAAAYREVFYGRLVPATAGHRSSMLQDLERGRPTEIDAINGWVAGRGAELGVPAPVNATLARVIRACVRRPLTRGDRWTH